ncbi:MAG: YeeE/YedE thiosulfate transporter family protein [Bacteroidota bacterium]
MDFIEFIKQPWSWYFSGAVIAVIMVLLIFFGKTFGFSSNLRTICAMCGAGKHVKFFDFDWKKNIWNLLFLAGAVAGGFIAHHYLFSPQPVQISQATINDLQKLGFAAPQDMLPGELYGIAQLTSIKSLLLLIGGGLSIGFGTRWAGGCTSGHAITGLSQLQLPSLITVIGFFIGGLFMTHVLYPFIF